ncbi:MAG TPA: hypothetical protein PKA13_00145 [Geminicoccaceae bacterium]|nr:hypothetical protein [Geminicoccus sp.]HMU48147.1 hypothetical protein [Geminicoccaceae bacterium]
MLALASASRLADVAAMLSVSLSTVRTLLERVFEKTGTHRQADLARLLIAHRNRIGRLARSSRRQ